MADTKFDNRINKLVLEDKIKKQELELIEVKKQLNMRMEEIDTLRTSATPVVGQSETVQLRLQLQQKIEEIATLQRQVASAGAVASGMNDAVQVRSEMESKVKALEAENERLAAQVKVKDGKDSIQSIEDIPEDLVLKLKKEFNLKSTDDWDKAQQKFDEMMQQQS